MYNLTKVYCLFFIHVQPVVVKTQNDHEYLAKLYGKALYEGHRRTLKKAPYLRFTSPTLKSKSQRPKVIETVRGELLKCVHNLKLETILFSVS